MSRARLDVTLMLTFVLFGTGLMASPPQDDEEHPDQITAEGADPAAGVQDGQLVDLAELERRLAVLAEEVERLRSGEDVAAAGAALTPAEIRALGLAPSAAATYGRDDGVSIAGYGEMLYENFDAENQAGGRAGRGSQVDFVRAVLYAGYRFNDKFLFNSEIEIEHADEVFVEFAYVDYLAHENFGIRGGMVLLPMGLVNEFHEPTVFLGATRPVTEQRIIPSTWRANGGGVHGSVDRLSYRAFVVNGLDGTQFSANGIRGGRQKGSRAKAGNMAVTGRLDVTMTPGVFVGASLYSGGAGHGEVALDGTTFDVGTTVVDLHGQAQVRGVDLRGLYARTTIDDASELNQVLGLDGTDGVAEAMHGGYLQVGYNVLSQVSAAGRVALTPFFRYEYVDTQATMPEGFARSEATSNTFTTLGVEVKPIPSVVVKVDYGWVRNDDQVGVNQFNVGLGYAF